MADYDCEWCPYEDICKHAYDCLECEFKVVEKYNSIKLDELRNASIILENSIKDFEKIDIEERLDEEIQSMKFTLFLINDKIDKELELEYKKMKEEEN